VGFRDLAQPADDAALADGGRGQEVIHAPQAFDAPASA
jgi:hypothetical protein